MSQLNLYPLSFTEFLGATGNEALLSPLEERDFRMMNTFHSRYVDLLKLYFFTGGMPAAVLAYLQSRNLSDVREVGRELLSGCDRDFSRHVPHALIPRIRMVWESIPAQLAKENKKFMYSVLRKGARARDFESAIWYLEGLRLCCRADRVTTGAVPLKAYEDIRAFKLFVPDVGLLTAMFSMDPDLLLRGNAIFSAFNGALTQQYVCQQIVSELGKEPYYWSAPVSSGELDFVLQHRGRIIPLEVKALENPKAKSLRIFVEKNSLPFGVRISLSPYRKEERLINIPLYAVSRLLNTCDEFYTLRKKSDRPPCRSFRCAFLSD